MKGTALQAALIYQKYEIEQSSIIAMTDVTGSITYVNDKLCEISGYSKEELIGKNHRILNSNNQPKSYWQAMYKAVTQGNIWHDEIKNKAKDGHYYWVDTTIVPFLDSEGIPDSYVAIQTDITHQKELANNFSSQTYAVEQHSIIARTDVSGSIIYVNDKFCEISGYSKEELIGQNHRILNSGNQPKSYWKAMYQVMIQGGVWQDEVKNKAKDGHYYWVDTTIVPCMDLDGKPESYISVRTDITTQKELADALVDQKFAMDQHAIIATTDVTGKITYANKKFSEISGYSQEELIGQNHRIINSGNQPKSYWKAMYQTVSKGYVWKDEVKNMSKDGSYYWVDTSIVPFMDSEGKPNSYISIRTDITHQKKIEEILSHQRFAMEQHSIIALTDVTGSITYVNNKFCEISGYLEEELIGQNHRILNSGNQPKSYWEAMYKALVKNGIWQDEVKNKAKDGHYYWVDTTIVPFLNSKGKPDTYISIRTDITKYKQIQEKLKQHQDELEELVLKRTLKLEEANKELKALSEIDPLTKLANRRKLISDFNYESKRATRFDRKMAFFYLDLNRFKAVNDELGHEVGDALLQYITEKLSHLLREAEYIYRVGGDEFCILIPEFIHIEQLKVLAKRIVEGVSSINHFGGIEIDIGCSIGIAIFPDNGKTLSDITSSADRAMYLIKISDNGDYGFAEK